MRRPFLSLSLSPARPCAHALSSCRYKAQEQLLLNRLRRRRHGERPQHASFFAHALAFVSFGLYHTRDQQEEEQEARVQDEGARRGSVDDGEVIEEEKERMDEQRYEEAITELKRERDREFRSQLVVSFSLFLVFWLVGAAAFSALEGWCVRLPPLALPPLEAFLRSTSSAHSRTTSSLTLAL